jgi:hypothetical protein
MAAELLSTKWGRIADMTATDALADPAGTGVTPGGLVSAAGQVTGTMGYYCIFNMDEGTDADYTHHFDFPINGDLTIVVNSGGSNLPNATTMDVSVQGSVDNVNFVDLHTDIIDGVSIDDAPAAAVYDYDAKGRMPYMRLELTAASNASDESIMIHVIPH